MAADGFTSGPDPFTPLNGASPPTSGVAGDGWAPILPAPLPLPERIRHRIHGEPSSVWRYHDGAGALLFAVCRFDKDGGGKEVLPYCCGPGGWRWKAPPSPRPLYGLDRLAARPGAPVLVVEGEKAADAAAMLFPDRVAVAWQGGTNAVGKADWSALRGCSVAVWPDADAPGRKAASEAAKAAGGAGAARAAVVAVPAEWPESWDLADFGRADRPQPPGVAAAALRAMLDAAPDRREPSDGSKGDKQEVEARENKRDQVIAAVLDAEVAFWRDARGAAHATVRRDGRVERHAVRSTTFKNIVRLSYGDANPVAMKSRGAHAVRPGSVPDQALSEALGAFEALALRGAEREPRPRLCREPDGGVWLDLGRPDWSLVRIEADGWRLVEAADVPLVRPAGLGPLPVPARSPGALADLGELLNLRPGEKSTPSADFMLAVAWLVAALHPEGPFPVLALDGEQGSAKTTTARMLRRLVDPNVADVRAVPREERDLLIAARNGRVVALDNLSSLDAQMADALCRVATGGGLGERALYTNGEEHVVHVQNPVLLNGIPSLLARGDLADRAVALTLPAIPDERRRPEADIWRDFDRAAPGVLALLLDALAMALRDGPGLRLPRLPRMADFARVACAAAPAFGWSADAMIAAMEENRAGAVAGVIEADAIASAVQAIAGEQQAWTGTSTDLLAKINEKTALDRQRERDWPKDATRLSARLRRVAPALRRAGVELTLPDAGGRAGRLITVQQKGGQRSERSERSEAAETREHEGVDGNAGQVAQRSASVPGDGAFDDRNAAWNAEGARQRSVFDSEKHSQNNEQGSADAGWNARNAGNAAGPFVGTDEDELVL